METSYLGIEIGGTKLQAALGDGRGQLWLQERCQADARNGAIAIRAQLIELVAAIRAAATAAGLPEARAVGIGFGGPVSVATGRTIKSHQVTGWDCFPLVTWAEAVFQLPTFLGNDADLAGLAEALFGAGQGASPVLYMNIGSGIGGAIVIDGKLFTGQGWGAAEFGHARVPPLPKPYFHNESISGWPWPTLEDCCSGWNLQRAWQTACQTPPDALAATSLPTDSENLTKGQSMTPADLLAAYAAGDPVAQEVWEPRLERLALVLANLVATFDPRVFIFGGGVALAGPLLLEPLLTKLKPMLFAPFAGHCQWTTAQLGEAVVLHGATTLARQQCDG